MEGISQWAVSVSICAAVVCIVEMLLSDTALEKTVRFVLGAFLLGAVLLPLGGVIQEGIQDIGWTEYTQQPDVTQTLNQQRKSYLEQALAGMIVKGLREQKGISPAKVEVHTDIDEQNCISIITAEVMLTAAEAEQGAAVSRYVKQEWGIECRTVIVS